MVGLEVGLAGAGGRPYNALIPLYTNEISPLLTHNSGLLPMTRACESPVIFLIFNRPETTRAVFEAIRRAQPRKLLIVADGPRPHRPEDVELCRQTREVVSHVDWDCEVYADYSQANLGCRSRVVSGLNWAFTLVEEAIIFEDDCLPDDTFFPFCEELLDKYRDDLRIHAIAGSNLIASRFTPPESYYLCKLGSYWGWATWRSRWVEFDEHLQRWPALRESNALAEIFDRKKDVGHWTQIFDTMYEGKGASATTWDYQWSFVGFFAHRTVLVPRVNLIKNIGFDADATHTMEVDPRVVVPVMSIDFPLIHPPLAATSIEAEHLRSDLLYATLRSRVVMKFNRVLRHLRTLFAGKVG